MPAVVDGRLGFLMNLAGFSRSLEHDGPSQHSSVPVELKTHKVEEAAPVFTLNGIRETKDLPVSFQLQAKLIGQILGDGKPYLVQNFLV